VGESKQLVDLLVDAYIKYIEMSIAHGGRLPSIYQVNWKQLGLSYKAQKLGFAPEATVGEAMRSAERLRLKTALEVAREGRARVDRDENGNPYIEVKRGEFKLKFFRDAASLVVGEGMNSIIVAFASGYRWEEIAKVLREREDLRSSLVALEI